MSNDTNAEQRPAVSSRAIGSVLGLVVLAVFVALARRQAFEISNNYQPSMQLTSPTIQAEQSIPKQFTCDGNDVSPQLDWSNVPEGTQSFVLVMRDPDAPNKEWVHWVVKNIPDSVTGVEENSVPENGVEVMNDFGRVAWGGPCPPDGEHRYYFELYALDVEDVSGSSISEVEEAMARHVLDKAELMAVYQR